VAIMFDDKAFSQFYGENGSRKSNIDKIKSWTSDRNKEETPRCKIYEVIGPKWIGKTFTVEYSLKNGGNEATKIVKDTCEDAMCTIVQEYFDMYIYAREKGKMDIDNEIIKKASKFEREIKKKEETKEKIRCLVKLLKSMTRDPIKPPILFFPLAFTKKNPDDKFFQLINEIYYESIPCIILLEKLTNRRHKPNNRPGLAAPRYHSIELSDKVVIKPLRKNEVCNFMKPFDGFGNELFVCDKSFDKLIPEKIGYHPKLLSMVCRKVLEEIKNEQFDAKERLTFLGTCIDDIEGDIYEYINPFIEFINDCYPNIYKKLDMYVNCKVNLSEGMADSLVGWSLLLDNKERIVPEFIKEKISKIYEKRKLTEGQNRSNRKDAGNKVSIDASHVGDVTIHQTNNQCKIYGWIKILLNYFSILYR